MDKILKYAPQKRPRLLYQKRLSKTLERPRHSTQRGELLKIRGQSFLVEFGLCYILSFYLLSFDEFSTLFVAIKEQVPPFSWFTSNLWAHLPFTYLIMSLMRFYFSLAIGIGPMSYLLGLRQSGDCFSKRVRAALKVAAKALLAPLYPLYLILLWRGHDPLDKMLGPYQKASAPFRGLVFFFLPLILLFSLGAPLLRNLGLIQGLEINMQKVERPKMIAGLDYTQYKNYQSNLYKLKIFSSLGDGRFIFIPTFQLAKVGPKSRLHPSMQLYDSKAEEFGEFSIANRFSLFDLIAIAKKNDFFFGFKYPTLNRLLERKWPYHTLKYEGQKEALLPTEAVAEIRDLVSASFRLSAQTLVAHILTHGPFIHGHVFFRSALLAQLDLIDTPEISFIRLGNSLFLRFRQDFSGLNFEEYKLSETLIPLDTNNALAFHLKWKGGEQEEMTTRQFYSQIFSASEWFFDFEHIFPFPFNKDKMDPFTVLDFFGRQLNKTQQNQFEMYLFSYYYQLAKRAVEEEGDDFRLFLLKSLTRLIKAQELLNKKNTFVSDNLSKHLRKLSEALETNQRTYFQ